MACNCVTERQMAELYRAIGKDNIADVEVKGFALFKVMLIRFFVTLMMLFIAPMLFFFVVYKTFVGDGKISLADFFELRKHE